MNKQQFMQLMELQLSAMDPQERAELLADYEQHFELGLVDGRTEEDIARELGQPEEIAREVLGDRYVMDSMTMGTDYSYEGMPTNTSPPKSSTTARNVFTGIGLVFLNLMLGFPLGLLLWSVWLTVAGFSLLALTPIAAVIDLLFFGEYAPSKLFFSIAACGIGILFAMLARFLFKAFSSVTLQYVKWNKKTIQGEYNG
ncbi:DUF1700 domain-containing protein [Paenibacillus tundrae]|jgi:uncharacterized membrane protein|uniref:Membrane protein n=1 Tax=Paenibacillus tundrae TaxID=528187 RepID=A0ABT9WGV8_9BACL|nr:DUF1700 domain-containing protein [Paenibacillus tundrae]MDQ0172494.1 putative membrane protein [Paenibacillus tundrae]